MKGPTANQNVGLILAITIFACAAQADAGTYYVNGSDNCELLGDIDLYGIGIRVGLYLQWVSILIALLLAPSESIPTFTASNIITFAIIISLLAGISNESLLLADWIIVTCLTFVLFIGLTPGVLINYSDHLHSTMMFCVLCIMYSVLLIPLPWVTFVAWSHGQTSSCRFKSWLMLNTGSYPGDEGASTLPKSMSIVGGLVGICMLCGALYFICRRLWLDHRNMVTRDISRRPKEGWNRNSLKSPIRIGFIVLTAFGFGTFAITTVEITIARNRIDLSRAPLNNAGQLIPFLSGLINMLVICWSAVRGINGRKSAVRRGRTLTWKLENEIANQRESNWVKIVELERSLKRKAEERMPKIEEEEN